MYEELSFDDYADEYARGHADGFVGCFDHSGDWEYKRGYADGADSVERAGYAENIDDHQSEYFQ